MRSFCLAILFNITLFLSSALPHALGVDKGKFVEIESGQYELISIVPQSLAPLISTPKLPERCSFNGSPGGEKGMYEVRFSFNCASPLTVDDRIVLPWKREGVLLTAQWLDTKPITKFLKKQGTVIAINMVDFSAGSGSFWNASKRYTHLGFIHILEGFDHLLFILGLLLLVRGVWPLIKTITAFTLAHSITLALATLGFVNFSSKSVEAAIALSIVFLAVEIINSQRGRASLTQQKPWLVSFGFGLLHGFGFAGALTNIGLPQAEIPQALFFFNVGVELGQLLFVMLALSIAWSSYTLQVRWHKWAVTLPSYILGTLAAYWTLHRTIIIFGGSL